MVSTSIRLLTTLAVASLVNAATVPTDPWTSLTPSATLDGATSSLSGTYAISLADVTSDVSSVSAAEKRDVSQIDDGQVQANSASVAAQITDGQVQAQSTAAAASVVAQITDGQIQAQSTAAAASVVNQITDGQIQAQSTAAAASVVNQIGDGQIQAQSASVVAQIGDGQIQAQSASVVAQIGDGQIQAQSASVVAQITDGQVQAQSTATAAAQISDGQVQDQSTVAAASQVSDGQVQNPEASSTPESEASGDFLTTCVSSNALTVTLEDGILRDSYGRIGSIVANRQFQFDGPPPQAGAIYAAGWSVKDGDLAIGDNTLFYKCQSGDFANIYDESIGGQCTPVNIKLLQVVSC